MRLAVIFQFYLSWYKVTNYFLSLQKLSYQMCGRRSLI